MPTRSARTADSHTPTSHQCCEKISLLLVTRHIFYYLSSPPSTITTSTMSEVLDVEVASRGEEDEIPAVVESDEPPPPAFQIGQRVMARDPDGLLYPAIVRRPIYGPHHHRPVHFGTVPTDKATNEDEDDEDPEWHYFVHYLKWNVKFDRWVSEPDLFEPTPSIQALSDYIWKEHKALQSALRQKPTKGKTKGFQRIDGAEFLLAWGQRIRQIQADFEAGTLPLDKQDHVTPPPPPRRKAKPDGSSWTTAKKHKEASLRHQSLTHKRPTRLSNMIPLPLALKKILVDQWEIVCQCGNVSKLPAPLTVRHALQKYVASKQTTALDASAMETDESNDWNVMADGICQLFDEANRSRLLYREEIPQAHVLDTLDEYKGLKDSEIYGCEYLLRLFVRLPELLSDAMDEEESRTIVAKINDLVRFLQKNEDTLFQQMYRSMNEAELKEKQRLEKLAERKLKRKHAESTTTEDETIPAVETEPTGPPAPVVASD